MTDDFIMPGSEVGHAYTVVAVSSKGRIGFRDVDDSPYQARVRVEPKTVDATASMKKLFPDWVQPSDDKVRFSKICTSLSDLPAMIKKGLEAIKHKDMQPNAAMPEWALDLFLKVRKTIVEEKDEKKIFEKETGRLFGKLKQFKGSK